jgi:hypothetical protein
VTWLENTSFSGDTRSKWKVAMVFSDYAASAASFLPFSTACSMVPTM